MQRCLWVCLLHKKKFYLSVDVTVILLQGMNQNIKTLHLFIKLSTFKFSEKHLVLQAVCTSSEEKPHRRSCDQKSHSAAKSMFPYFTCMTWVLPLTSHILHLIHCAQVRLQPVKLGWEANSVVFGSQVSKRLRYCWRDEVYFTAVTKQ